MFEEGISLRQIDFETTAIDAEMVMDKLGFTSYAPLDLQRRNANMRAEDGVVQRNFRSKADPFEKGKTFFVTLAWLPDAVKNRPEIYIQKGSLVHSGSGGSAQELYAELGKMRQDLEALKGSVSDKLGELVDGLTTAIDLRMLNPKARLEPKPRRGHPHRTRFKTAK